MLKGGFIGFGRMGITHFSILNTHPSVNVIAVCDQSKTMLKILGKYIDIKTYTDYRKMMDECNLDFVVISTPTSSHSEIIQAAIDTDLHIFVEKPFAISASEGLKTMDCLAEKPLVNQVGYVNRFNEVFIEVKRLLEAGAIGDIKNFSSEMYGATITKDAKGGWRSAKKMGGGAMFEFGSHCIDLVVYLMGQPDIVTGSVMQSIYSSHVEDLVGSTFVYNKGYTGTILSNWCDVSQRKPTNIVKIVGTRGKLVADRHSFKIYLREADEANGFHQGWNTRYITDFARSVRFYVRGNEFTRQLDYFIDCIEQNRTDNISSFKEALKTDIVMEQVINDAEQTLNRPRIVAPNLTSSPTMSKDTKQSSGWRFWKRGY